MHGHDRAPCRHQDAHVDRRPVQALEESIARYFKQNVGHKEQGEDNIPLHAADPEIFVDTFDLYRNINQRHADLRVLAMCNPPWCSQYLIGRDGQ